MNLPHAFHGHPAYIAIWLVTYGICIVREIRLSQRLRSGPDAQKLDRGSEFIVVSVANLAVLVGFVASILVPELSIDTHWKRLFVAGIVVWVSGMLFRWYSIYILGRFFTYDVAVSSEQYVVESVPYRWLRHPSYLGALLAEIGLGMTLTNWIAILLPVVCLAAAYSYRIKVEEHALSESLGSPYREYMRRTWRLIPFLY